MTLSSYNSTPPLMPYLEDASSSTTINPVFKYTSSLTRILPTSEFDPRTLHEMLRQSESPVITYSTQSLDRKAKLKHSSSMRDEVILRPLSHRPFDYLQRPSSVIETTIDPHYQHRYYPPVEFHDRYSSTHSIRDVAL